MNVPVRVLDPVTAVIAPGQSAVGSTAYVADLDVVMTALAPALAELGWMVASVDEPRRTDVKQVARREYRGHVTLTIEQGKERLTTVPDAWVALQHLALADPRLAALVHLDHLVAACPGYWDGIAGYWDGIAGYWDGIAGSSQAPAEFGRPGFGGKAPVITVTPGNTLGISVDPEVADNGWFPVIGQERLSQTPITSTYFRFTFPTLQQIPADGFTLQIVARGSKPDITRGLWIYKLQPAAS